MTVLCLLLVLGWIVTVHDAFAREQVAAVIAGGVGGAACCYPLVHCLECLLVVGGALLLER